MTTEKKGTREFDIYELFHKQPMTSEEHKLSLKIAFKKNKKLARFFLVVMRLSPVTARKITDVMSVYSVFTKNQAHYYLNKLLKLKVISSSAFKDISTLKPKIREMIEESQQSLLNKIPKQFHENNVYLSIRYFWVNEYGLEFKEYCYNHVIKGLEKKNG